MKTTRAAAVKVLTLGVLFPAVITLVASVSIALADTGPRQGKRDKVVHKQTAAPATAPVRHFWSDYWTMFRR